MRTTTKQAGLFAASTADTFISADIARIDWLNDTQAGSRAFRKVGEANAQALTNAVYNAFGLDVSFPKAKVALRKAGFKRSKLSAKDLKALQEGERVAQSISRAKRVAFGVKKAARKAKPKSFKASKAVLSLVSAIKAMGYGVKLTHGPAK